MSFTQNHRMIMYFNPGASLCICYCWTSGGFCQLISPACPRLVERQHYPPVYQPLTNFDHAQACSIPSSRSLIRTLDGLKPSIGPWGILQVDFILLITTLGGPDNFLPTLSSTNPALLSPIWLWGYCGCALKALLKSRKTFAAVPHLLKHPSHPRRRWGWLGMSCLWELHTGCSPKPSCPSFAREWFPGGSPL